MAGGRRRGQTGVTMHIYRTRAPGNDVVVQHITTRDGERLCLLVDDEGSRHLFTYDGGDLDTPAWEIVLEPDEADRLAEILHSRPVQDRLLSRERRVDELIGERGR
jgi:K+/H+ antiporter YhaU regulatory subunit KhtT